MDYCDYAVLEPRDTVLPEFVFTGGGQESSRHLALTKQPGYKYQHRNGQRIFGPPYNWEGSPPQKGCEVFVTKLPQSVFEDELFRLFSRAGVVYQMRLMVDFSGTRKGFGFVQFSRPEEACHAVVILNNYEIRYGMRIEVYKSIDNCRLYVGNIPKDKTKAQLVNFFMREVDGIVDVTMYQLLIDTSLNRGFMFLEFASHTEAAIARKKLKLLSLIPDHLLVVDWAVPEREVPNYIMKKVKILFVRNLLLSTTEDTIWKAMASVSEDGVVKIKKIADFAFVHFATRDQAQMALMFWNNNNLDGSIIEVAWAKPPSKLHCNIQETTNPTGLSQEEVASNYSRNTNLPLVVVKSCKEHCFLCNHPNYISQFCLWFRNSEENFITSVFQSIPPQNNAQHPSTCTSYLEDEKF